MAMRTIRVLREIAGARARDVPGGVSSRVIWSRAKKLAFSSRVIGGNGNETAKLVHGL